MSEGDLTGARRGTAADEAGRRDRVMGCAERAFVREAAVAEPRHAVDAGDLDGFLEGGSRQDARKPPREHRLACPGRADHQQVVAARGGYLEGSTRLRLTED